MPGPELIIGPLLRHVGETDATVWVETDAPCEVDVLGARSRTFCVAGHHYALVVIEGLEPGGLYPYAVELDGRRAWPPPDSRYPASVIRTLDPRGPARVSFGSCRVGAPHEPPWSLPRDQHEDAREIDALLALAERMRHQPPEAWPELIVFLGDQVYADEVSPEVERFIRARRPVAGVPEVGDFEEYTRLYWESWSEPAIRWVLSTVASAMIFDDHDVHDDWNTSHSWRAEMTAQPWWRERIAGAFMSYWVYQHLGNLSVAELRADRLLARVREASDGGPALHDAALAADREPAGRRWSYRRDLGRTRLVVVDSRAGRVLTPGRRDMLDEDEWRWVDEQLTGEVEHLLIATSLPFLLSPGMHDLEAWNEAVGEGAWGPRAAGLAERMRQRLDLEHWAAFERSFRRLGAIVEDVAAGRRGSPPASIVFLSGDVHHAYLAEVGLPEPGPAGSAVFQATCSPFRNPLDAREQRAIRAALSRPAALLNRTLARAAGVPAPTLRWEVVAGPWFDNQVATLSLEGRGSRLTIEKTAPVDPRAPRLETVLDRVLTGPAGSGEPPPG